MKRFRIWDILLGGALVAALVHMVILVRQRAILMDAIDGATADRPETKHGDERLERLGDVRADRDRLAAEVERLRASCEALDRQCAALQSDLTLRKAEGSTLGLRIAELETNRLGLKVDELSGNALRQELLAMQDRLEKAYRDIAELEVQLVEVSRMKNDLEARDGGLREGGSGPHIGDLDAVPKIDGVVLGVSDKVNLVLVSVGAKDKVQVGYKFTVYRGSQYVSKVVVEKVEDSWAACRELTDFRKEAIQQGDNVSTRVFD